MFEQSTGSNVQTCSLSHDFLYFWFFSFIVSWTLLAGNIWHRYPHLILWLWLCSLSLVISDHLGYNSLPSFYSYYNYLHNSSLLHCYIQKKICASFNLQTLLGKTFGPLGYLDLFGPTWLDTQVGTRPRRLNKWKSYKYLSYAYSFIKSWLGQSGLYVSLSQK